MGTQVEKANFVNYKPIVLILGVTVAILLTAKILNKTMDKKALIAVGVIAVLGVATYAIIVSKNTPIVVTNSGATTTTPATTNSSNTNTYVTLAQSAMCKFFNIGCPPAPVTTTTAAATTTPSTAVSL